MMVMGATLTLIFVPITLAIIYSVYIIFWLKKQHAGSEAMTQLSRAIQEGSSAYLKRQYKSVALVALI